MKARFVTLLLFSGGLMAQTASSTLSPQPGQITNLYSIAITAPEKAEAGAQLLLGITLTNESQHTILLAAASPSAAELNYTVDVRDDHGQLVQMTEYYQRLRHSLMVPWTGGKNMGLLPADTADDDIDLNKLYDLKVPGFYTIQVQRSGMTIPITTNLVKSNVITVEVVPSSGVTVEAPPEKPSFRIGLSVPGDKEDPVHVGESVKFQISLTNISKREIVLPQEIDKKGELDFRIELLRDDTGEPPPFTEYGRNLKDLRASMPASNWKLVHVAPGRRLVEEVVLSDLYDFQPGRYVVRVERIDESVKSMRARRVVREASVFISK